MSEMNEIESMERFAESLKKAASRCRQLGVLQKNKGWDALAMSLDGIRKNGQKLFVSKSMSRQDTLKILDAEHKKTVN